MPSWREWGARFADLSTRVGVLARVANQTGLMWEITRPGLSVMKTVFTPSAKNPALIYRMHAVNAPNKVALRFRDLSYTFAELDEQIDRVAAGLRGHGVRRGSKLIVMLKNRPEFLLLQCGSSRAGCSAVSVSWRSTPAELAYLAQNSGAKVIAVERELVAIAEQATRELPGVTIVTVGGEAPGHVDFESLLTPGPIEPDSDPGALEDAAVVIYTSGTTGKPKGAVRKFPAEALPAALQFIAETPMRSDDVHLVACPLYHSTAFGFITLSHLLGCTVVIADEFKPESFLRDVERHGVTTTAVVPTMLHRVLALPKDVLHRYRTRSLRILFVGGAPLPAPLGTAAMDHFGDILFNFYGATETGLVTLGKPEDLRAAPGSIGRVVPGNEVRLLDDRGRDVPRGEVGELYVRSKALVAGYHKDDAATRESMRDGFFSVGDLARQDRDGRYFIEGRKRDMIISGGVNVYPAEVEAALEAHPGLVEVAVVGVQDPEWGERVRAFVVKHADADVDEVELKSWARGRLAGPKVPRDFVFLDALPRNPTGKVLKRELRGASVTDS